MNKKSRRELLELSDFVRQHKDEMSAVMDADVVKRIEDAITKKENELIAPGITDMKERIKKLEALHKTDKLAEFPEESKGMPKDSVSLIEKFLDYQSHGGIKEVWVKANLDIFIRWLYERGYEIRDKFK